MSAAVLSGRRKDVVRRPRAISGLSSVSQLRPGLAPTPNISLYCARARKLDSRFDGVTRTAGRGRDRPRASENTAAQPPHEPAGKSISTLNLLWLSSRKPNSRNDR
ncbi:hypothetical protein EVAR_38683_1 [Eumeta japonica]|uniref:Uncharacterized protein n=1 Tax=Eumeta variegata TaxID=151549 RepID=A0A4C1Y9H8_EUMVA|nr:hypothetical protein EVAR_38683_1 [Eumeta japonica]